MSLEYIPGATTLVTDPLTNMTQADPVGIWLIISYVLAIISGIAGAWLWLGYLKTQFMILEDKKPIIKDLISTPLLYVVRLIAGEILIGIAVVLWLILLIIPGIYIAIRLSMFKYFIVEWYGIMDALKASRAVTKWNVWKLIGIRFVYTWIILLWILALGVGLLRAIPTIVLAQAYIYTQLKKELPDTLKPIH
jgi:hypothetical protein